MTHTIHAEDVEAEIPGEWEPHAPVGAGAAVSAAPCLCRRHPELHDAPEVALDHVASQAQPEMMGPHLN